MMTNTWLRRLTLRGVAVLALAAACGAASAATEISNTPLGTMTNGTAVRSNLMFVLDNSGSMNWNYLPDDAPRGDVCFGASDRNRIFYDPTQTYDPPLAVDGQPMPKANFTAAWDDGYNTGSGSPVNLTQNNPETPEIDGPVVGTPSSTTETKVCGTSNATACRLPEPNPSRDVNTSGTNTVVTEVLVERVNAAGKTCNRNTANSCALKTTTTVTTREGKTGHFLWAKRNAGAASSSCNVNDFTIVRYSGSLSAAEQQNYANWFAYYRTRMLAMRAGAGRAFAQIDASRFRVGFSKISDYANGGADSTGFLNIRDYDYEAGKTDDQKVAFFSRLYNTSGTGNTPLRPALARAGRYFANKLDKQLDPMQYSCQRNYTILSTDGYWNQDTAAPKDLDGNTIGNTDAGTLIERPMRDEFNGGKGVGGTLADVAMYYYTTDLRSVAQKNCSGSVANQDVCENNVPTDLTKDTNKAQHMTTFTLGLGLSGTLTYDPKYETQTSGDYVKLKQGNLVWPDPINNTGAERIDDLWHAAVNGRGTYYAASDAKSMATSLIDALSKISEKQGSSAAAATSSLTPSSGDDWIFIPTYNTKSWDGDVKAYRINTATGELLNENTPIWSAAQRIGAQSARTIYFNGGSSTAPVRSLFTADGLSSAGKLSHFDNLCGSKKLSQCATLGATALAKVTATNVVNFLRGSSTYEQSAKEPNDQVFRTRAGPLGDIVNGAPVYVKKPPLGYGDGYAAYAAKDRQAVLYVAANDGMLHALKVASDNGDVTGGTELWAYVPSMVMSNMYLLADADYQSKHVPFVDAAPVVADVHNGSEWRTILIGGLGKGGRGYYALDITVPEAPLVLWEFTDTDLGYTFGNPVVTKNKAGKWVVAFSSGYNNVSPGDGKGYLYVLDALKGTLIDGSAGAYSSKIPTGAGDAGTPSNLGRINAWVEDDKLNVAARFYGGDMLGNVWRIDFDDNLGAAGREAFKLGTTGAGQPITTKPVLSEIISGNYRYATVSVATGRYLGVPDVGDVTTQSIYTFKDDLSTTSQGALRSNAKMVQQTMAADRKGLVNGSSIDWATQAGWFVDLSLSPGERVNVDFDQQLNQLIVASNIPTPTVCSPGGSSYLYFLDIGTGRPLLSYASTTLAAGITTIASSTGKLITLVQGVDGKNQARTGADPATLPPGALRRTSWRELMN